MADACMVLGISKGPTSIRELAKLQKRSKELCKYYLKRDRRQDAKKVEWAYQQLKKAVKASEKSAQGDVEIVGVHSDRGEKRGAEKGQDPAAPEPKKRVADRRADRREAIKEKLAARRAEKESAVADKEKRQDAIKERLAAKRLMKQVRVLSEDESRRGALEILASQAPKDARVCLICPVSIERIKTPARGGTCKHLQCFDLEAYLFGKCTACPVCERELDSPGGLVIDGFFKKVVDSAAQDVNEVAFASDGSWQACTGDEEGDAESDWSGMSDVQSDHEAGHDVGSPGTPDVLGEPDTLGEAAPGGAEDAEDAAAAAAAAAASAAKADAIARIREEVAAAKEEARRASDERKLKAVLPFIPSRAQARAAEAAKAAELARAEASAGAGSPEASATDERSYVVVELAKPMGIVFAANPPPAGGVCVASFHEGGPAASHGGLRKGDQLVGVGPVCVMGRGVEACMEAIAADPSTMTTLTIFRGKPAHLYGQSDANKDWIACLLDRVRDGSLRPSPPLERRGSMASPPEASESGDDGASSDPLEDPSPRPLPPVLAKSITGSGLHEDLAAAVEALQSLGADAPPAAALPRAVVRAVVEHNTQLWHDLGEDQAQWRRGARKRIAQAAAARVEELRRRRPARGRGGEPGALLVVEPRPVKFTPQGTAKLLLKNSAAGHVAFRIRTNAPSIVQVQPCAGTLPRGEQVVARIKSSDRRIGRRGVRFVVHAVAVDSPAELTRERWAEFGQAEVSEWVVQGSE